MKRLFKFSTAILAIVIIMGLLPINVSANTKEFVDVPREHEYYNEIMLLADRGIISGYSDGSFKPDKGISVAEAITITEKVFGNPENLPEWEKWEELTETGYMYKTDWEIDCSSFFNKYNLATNWELGSHLILNSNRALVLSAEVFGKSNDYIYFNNVLFRGYETDRLFYQAMTRGEFCDLVVWAIDYIHNIPDYKIDFPVKYTYIGAEYSEEDKKIFETSALGSFLRAPEWLLKYYSKNNGSIKIVEESKWDTINHKESAGYIDYNSYRYIIYIRDASPSVALHELGHFIWFEENICMSNDIMAEESDALRKISLSSYCETNIEEYFAEAFQCYYLEPYRLKNEAPKTFKFINEIVTNLENKVN